MKEIAWILLGWLALVVTANAASFDCTKATLKVEKLVCDTPFISKLDDDLGKAYQEVSHKANKEQKLLLATEQKYWLKNSRNLCTDENCVKQAYQSRLNTLARFFEISKNHLSNESDNMFCAEIRKMKHSVVSTSKGAFQTVYTYALDKSIICMARKVMG
jgi:uncharacterized protein